VGRTDRAHGDQLPIEELDALVFERAQLDELVVFHTAQRADDFNG
jgi:hypothetical protein